MFLRAKLTKRGLPQAQASKPTLLQRLESGLLEPLSSEVLGAELAERLLLELTLV